MRAFKIVGLALEGLRRAPLRASLTAIGVTIASGALVSMIAFALGLQRQVETPFRALALLNNIQVTPKEGGDARNAPPLDADAVQRIEQIPGVALAWPDIRVRGVKLRYGDKTAAGIALGVPREASLFGVEEEILVAGRFFQQNEQPEAVVGLHLVQALGFDSPQKAIGTTMMLDTTGLAPSSGQSFQVQHQEFPVVIVGVYRAPMLLPEVAHQGIVLPVELMKKLPGIGIESALNRLKSGGSAVSSGYSTVTVRVRDPSDLASVQEQIRAMGFETRTVLSRLREMQTFFFFLQVLLGAVGTIGLVIAALGIVNTLLMSVLERQQEIGIYKAIGASDGDVFVLFLTEAGIIGLAGGLGGLALGRAVAWGLEIAANVYARRHGSTEHLDLFTFPLGLLALTVLFAVLISMLAGVYPALRAARVDPIRALRRD